VACICIRLGYSHLKILSKNNPTQTEVENFLKGFSIVGVKDKKILILDQTSYNTPLKDICYYKNNKSCILMLRRLRY
jgi:hypothetical protein